MKNNFFIICIIFLFITSCSGFKLKRSQNADEFLIEKKNPLVMPPDINDLPKPKEALNDSAAEDEDFKEILKSTNSNTNNSNLESSSSLEESIIKKIEN